MAQWLRERLRDMKCTMHDHEGMGSKPCRVELGVHSTSILTLKMLVATIDAQWEGMGDVGSARYELALLPPCPTIRVLSYSN